MMRPQESKQRNGRSNYNIFISETVIHQRFNNEAQQANDPSSGILGTLSTTTTFSDVEDCPNDFH